MVVMHMHTPYTLHAIRGYQCKQRHEAGKGEYWTTLARLMSTITVLALIIQTAKNNY